MKHFGIWNEITVRISGAREEEVMRQEDVLSCRRAVPYGEVLSK